MKINEMLKWTKYAKDDFLNYWYSNSNPTYLVSFPKSGVTWLKFMLTQVLIKTYGLEDSATVDLNKLIRQNPQLPNIIWTHDNSHIIDEKGNINDIEKMFIYGGRLRYGKSRVILLVRDPRDVVVSHYFQVTKRSEKPLDLPSMNAFIRHKYYGVERIVRFYQIWNRNSWIPQQLLIVRYEDLLENGIATLNKILNFIDVQNVDSAVLKQVYEESQADKMRQLEMQGKVEGMRNFGPSKNALKVRRAKIGSYKDELSNDDIRYCNRIMKNLSRAYGYY